MSLATRLSPALLLFAAFLMPGSAAGQEATFRVTTEPEEPEHPFYQEGFPTKFAIDGVQGKELVLQKGSEYAFQMEEVPDFHPFYISTSADGSGSGQYDQGVSGNAASGNETLTFTPPTGAPDSLWYQCINHAKMGWRMAMVVDSSMAIVDADGEVSFTGTGVAIGFTETSGSGAVQVDKFNSAPTGTDGISESNVSQYRFFVSVAEAVSFGSDTEIRFDVSTLGGIGDASNVRVYRRPEAEAGTFTELATTYDSDANELVVTSGEGGEFAFASESEPLPVALAGFDARADGRAARLTWKTASERGNAGFEVQRRVRRPRATGSSWTAVGFVESKSAGSASDATRKYRFRDEDVPYGAQRVAYRLKQVDADGSTSLSGERTVRFAAPADLALRAPFPNPAGASARIRYALPSATEVRLALYNVLGERVATLVRGRRPAGRREAQLETSNLASGTYVLRLEAAGQVRTRKLAVVR